MEKSCIKRVPKASPRPVLILVKIQSNHCVQQIHLKIRYFERLSKIF